MQAYRTWALTLGVLVAAAIALVAIAGEDFGFDPDATDARDAIRAAERWWFKDGRRRAGR